MHLHLQDFQHQPAYIDYNTKNISFLKMHLILKQLGVKNNYFFLALVQKELMGVDPHDTENMTVELATKIAYEMKVNPWYFFREVLRVPAAGGDASPYQLNRAGLALIWTFFNNIDLFLTMPRQKGKTITSMSVVAFLLYVYCKNFNIPMYTRSTGLIQENVDKLKSIYHALPPYIIAKSAKDKDNKEGVSYHQLGNKFITLCAQDSREEAAKVGRGYTVPFWLLDEICYCVNIHLSYTTIIASTTTAAKIAAANNMPHTNIIVSTAGNLDDESGRYSYGLICDAMRFNENLYDAKNKVELHEIVKANSVNKMLYMEFSYFQLGETQEWYDDICRRSNAPLAELERDYLNKWKSGTDCGLIPGDLLNQITASKLEPLDIEIVTNYALSWYTPPEFKSSYLFQNRPFVIGFDSSENIGRDFSTILFMDPSDMAVVATCRCNESNIMDLGRFVLKLLLDYPKSVIIPERKSSGSFLIDLFIDELLRHKINPFKRIFNKIIQKRRSDEFKHIDIDSGTVVRSDAIRRHFGYSTTGEGSNSRNILYKDVLMKTLRLNHSRIHDPTLISELKSLTIKNGRIDHASGKHDDMVIAYLLASYFVLFGENLHYYGIDDSNFLSKITPDGTKVNPALKQEQLALRQRLNDLEERAKRCNTQMVRACIVREINSLKSMLDPTILETPIIAKEHLVQEEQKILNAPINDNTFQQWLNLVR